MRVRNPKKKKTDPSDKPDIFFGNELLLVVASSSGSGRTSNLVGLVVLPIQVTYSCGVVVELLAGGTFFQANNVLTMSSTNISFVASSIVCTRYF